MQNRRSFLKKLSLGLLSPIMLDTFSAQNSNNYKINLDFNATDFWEKVRAKFPLSNNRVYLNNGTFGPSPYSVIDSLKETTDKINTSGEYGNTKEARKIISEFVGVNSSEISLTHNTTEGINIMAWGIPLGEGDEVILTRHEHVGNALPWLNRVKLDGIVLKTFEPADTQEENLNRIKKLVTSKTRVIAVPHITCTTGLVLPIKEISDFAKTRGIFTAIDGAHGAGTFNLDLKKLGCDFYATCGHKWMLGPGGTGFLYVRQELLDTLQVYNVGAYSDTGWDLYSKPPKLDGYVDTAHRYDYGTQNSALYAALAEAALFQEEIGKEKIENRVQELSSYLYEGLSEFTKHLDILTPSEAASRICMITFKPKNREYREFASSISRKGFRIRVVPESNLDAIRISTHIYNSKQDIDSLLMALQQEC